ncbi:hypothetical protein BCR34DRAFT_124122 [Clohesyomyces aquaticus]|uniref:Uncharacterized protein n=1 Tax=Clohesyomyces aquaticus TaxID=1231657 RepID=A0A1Y1YPC9_9PLEO|nr:hypothetical protein BCR34DRAFT_124122 [Clohesyomyces aquaticus]
MSQARDSGPRASFRRVGFGRQVSYIPRFGSPMRQQKQSFPALAGPGLPSRQAALSFNLPQGLQAMQHWVAASCVGIAESQHGGDIHFRVGMGSRPTGFDETHVACQGRCSCAHTPAWRSSMEVCFPHVLITSPVFKPWVGMALLRASGSELHVLGALCLSLLTNAYAKHGGVSQDVARFYAMGKLATTTLRPTLPQCLLEAYLHAFLGMVKRNTSTITTFKLGGQCPSIILKRNSSSLFFLLPRLVACWFYGKTQRVPINHRVFETSRARSDTSTSPVRSDISSALYVGSNSVLSHHIISVRATSSGGKSYGRSPLAHFEDNAILCMFSLT